MSERPPLLPKHHEQSDFFIADIFDNLPFKDDMASMEHPVFSLSTKPDVRSLQYVNGNASVLVVPSSWGLPTIFDKDVLLYCSSLFMERINRGEKPPRTIRISIHDLLVATNRRTSGESYKLLKKTLMRLAGARIETSIKTGRIAQTKGFGLLESYEYIESSRVKDRLVALEITYSEWLYNALLSKEVLTIHKDYFRLRKSLDRRLYELARKHCGEQEEWKVGLEALHHKSGSRDVLKKFRAAIRKLIESNHLPDYTLSLDDKDMVTFRNRNPVEKPKKRGRPRKAKPEQQGELLLPETKPQSAEPIPEFMPPHVASVARQAAQGYDVYVLWEEFKQWNRDMDVTPNNWQKAFIGFCRKRPSL